MAAIFVTVEIALGLGAVDSMDTLLLASAFSAFLATDTLGHGLLSHSVS